MLQPKRTKYRKVMRGRMRGKAQKGSSVAFGQYGLKSLAPAWITARQIEAARRAITRSLHRGGQVWIRIYPDKPVTAKPAETRQGGGKGPVDRWVAVVKPGRVLFEIDGVPAETAWKALRLASQKLPIATRAVARTDFHAATRS
jgi:large subunit ribosomal protein L16